MNYDGKKLCAVPDHFGGADCLWPMPDISIYGLGRLGALNLTEVIEQAIVGWNNVCGIRLTPSTNAKTAHIIVTTGHIDGSAGTLGWSELPCGFTPTQWRQLQQQYDTGEMWVAAENPPGSKIDAVRVMCHELGHAIGISHINTGNLMAPTYSAAIRWPQRGDVAEAVMRYGRSTATPAPGPGGPGGEGPSPPAPGGDIWGRLFPCLLTYGFDIFAELDEAQRKALIRIGLNLLKRLTPGELEQLQKLTKE